ncbi:LysR family transcriptional regulator [Mycolicibacterium sp. YH-1]|uniref:LysR family transcriptional regulator n=1 Tax=Mycolicibacterium sp. YH-1 TaxID=2908837 RepID=UPI00352E0498
MSVADERSFTRAAARLNMAQPPLSQQIRKLEREIGAPLFVRTTRSVSLTHAGEVLYE